MANFASTSANDTFTETDGVDYVTCSGRSSQHTITRGAVITVTGPKDKASVNRALDARGWGLSLNLADKACAMPVITAPRGERYLRG